MSLHPRPDVMDLDWDTLIVLDATRYDLFEWVTKLGFPGELSRHVSRGSNTPEFIERNFTDPPYSDTVYLTANVVPSKKADRKAFHAFIPAWAKLWDEDYETVTPEDMTQALLETHEKFPNKRIIGHYAQPHLPFVGDLGLDFGKSHTCRKFLVGGEEEPVPSLDTVVKWRTAYVENLQIAALEAGRAAEQIDGKVVITSDHGEQLADGVLIDPDERGGCQFGHAGDSGDPSLREVPWHEIPGERRDIVAEEGDFSVKAGEDVDIESEEVERKLKALGYL